MNAETRERVLLQGGTVIDPQARTVRRADVLIAGGRIEKVEGSIQEVGGAEVIDCKGMHIAPGFTDMHCHLREPGREDE